MAMRSEFYAARKRPVAAAQTSTTEFSEPPSSEGS